jgi:hypothetical protein
MNSSIVKSADVRHAARGNWGWVLTALAPELEPALAKPGRHIGCPVHGGHDGFRLFRDIESSGGGVCNTCGPKPDGFALLMWLRNWDFPAVLAAVNSVLGGGNPPPVPAQILKAKPLRKGPTDEEIRQRLRKTWLDSAQWWVPAAKPLRDYLAGRGLEPGVLSETGGSIRFHPGLPCYDEDNRHEGTFPAMIGLVCDRGGRPITLHRTWLAQDGRKAPVQSPRKMMPIPSDRLVLGGAIRLGLPEASPTADIAEGIETALAVIQATGLPVWSSATAALLGHFVPPEGTRHVRIWCDLDRLVKGRRAGEDAAAKLRERLRLAGIGTEILLPPAPMLGEKKGVDWLDVLNECGASAFPFQGAGLTDAA